MARKSAAEGKPLTYGSVGVGSLYHVLAEHFAQKFDARMTHVPCKGGAPLGQDLAGGVLDLSFITIGAQQVALAEQGCIKILGTLAPAGKVLDLIGNVPLPPMSLAEAAREFVRGVLIGPAVGPLAQHRLDEAVGLAFLRAVRAAELVGDAQFGAAPCEVL